MKKLYERSIYKEISLWFILGLFFLSYSISDAADIGMNFKDRVDSNFYHQEVFKNLNRLMIIDPLIYRTVCIFLNKR